MPPHPHQILTIHIDQEGKDAAPLNGAALLQTKAMNTKTLCLAVLHEGDATGYDIRKASGNGTYGSFSKASFGAIYPALANLEANGLVSARTHHQDQRPAKKVYKITPLGQTEFRAKLSEFPGDDVFRSEFLLFARFAHLFPAALVKTRIDQRFAALDDALARLEKERSSAPQFGNNWAIHHAINCVEFIRADTKQNAADLIAAARADNAPANITELELDH